MLINNICCSASMLKPWACVHTVTVWGIHFLQKSADLLMPGPSLSRLVLGLYRLQSRERGGGETAELLSSSTLGQ